MKSRGRTRNRIKPKKGMWFVVAVTLVVCATLTVGKHNLTKKSEALSQKQIKIEEQISQANEKSKELDEQEAYMQTDAYAEEVAREKLGMVKDNEIIFKAKNK